MQCWSKDIVSDVLLILAMIVYIVAEIAKARKQHFQNCAVEAKNILELREHLVCPTVATLCRKYDKGGQVMHYFSHLITTMKSNTSLSYEYIFDKKDV